MNLFGQPTVEFCEKAGAGLVKRPFYALSNLAYLFSGLVILYQGRGSNISKVFGYTSIFIGLASFSYDASYTYISQLIDLLSMLFFVNVLIYLSVRRYFFVSAKNLIILQVLAVLAGMLSIIFSGSFSGEFVFGIFILFAIVLEFLLWRSKSTVNFKLWLKGLSLFILAFIVWLPDAMGTICDPSDYINGRSIFHILTAATIYLLYKYHEQQNPWNDEKLIEVLRKDGVVVMPTDTIYGILGRALSEEAVSRIYAARRRNPEKPSIILIGAPGDLEKFSIKVSEEQKKKLEEYWGAGGKPTSIVLDCPDESLGYLHRGTRTLAFRLPFPGALRHLINLTGPLIAPSANPEGLVPAKNVREAEEYFGHVVDFYVEGGSVSGEASRVIKLHKDGSVSILRE